MSDSVFGMKNKTKIVEILTFVLSAKSYKSNSSGQNRLFEATSTHKEITAEPIRLFIFAINKNEQAIYQLTLS